MAKCYRCGQWGLFLKTTDGFCEGCRIKVLEDARTKQQVSNTASIYDNYLTKTSAKSPKQTSTPYVRPTYNPSALLENVTRSNISRPPMLDGIPMVYSYVIYVSYVDRNALYEMTRQNTFDVKMSVLENGDISLTHNDIYIARFTSHKNIVTDWITNNLPYICQFTGFKNGQECVLLHLYRDDEARLRQCQMSIAKLTSCTSESKQVNISLLEEGQKLFIEDDDDGKLYVRDVNYHEIGKLPAKFSRMHEDGDLRGIFFDHNETVEDANGNETDIPYVRFYHN